MKKLIPAGNRQLGYDVSDNVFPSDKALLKALYLATFEGTKRWTMLIRDWEAVSGRRYSPFYKEPRLLDIIITRTEV